MNSTLSNIIIFTAGAAIGSVVTWKLLKTKYEQIADEEIKSVKEFYTKKAEESNNDSIISVDNEKPDIFEYAKKYGVIVEDNEYITAEGGVMEMDKPFVIAPEEYDEYGYETVSLTYYADGVLTDDMDNPINDVEGMVGHESLTHFGEFEDDSVYVRNHNIKTDFEILLDTRNFSDVKPDYTPDVEDE